MIIIKKYYLIIFFICCIFSYIVFNKFNNVDNELLLFGDIDILNRKFDGEKKEINTFFYDKVNVNELINSIKNNDYKIVKNKKIYLNQLIYSSNIVFIGVENDKSNKIGVLVDEINNIHRCEVIVVSNKCDDFNNKCISVNEYINYKY